MIQQSLNIIFRRFIKDPVFSFATLFGLALGLYAFILMSHFVNSMMSFDKQNDNYDRIYRLQLFMDQKENKITHSSSVTAALSRHELVNIPEIEEVALMHDVGDNNKNGVFLSPDKERQMLTRWGYYADQSVFNIFTFKLKEGNINDLLTQPNSIVLSEKCAIKLFGSKAALGQQVYIENKYLFTVTGVYDDVPDKSSWKPAFLLPMQTFGTITGWTDYENNYRAYSFYTYVLLKEHADPKNVDAKIDNALQEFNKDHHPYLRPMSQLYINPYFQPDLKIAIGMLAFNALLILLLSAINYINLQTANASTRFREIGIKKSAGYTKKQLWNQFILESLFIAFIAGILGLLLTKLTTPLVNRIVGVELLDNVFGEWKILAIGLVITLLTGLLSGIHPAYAISSFNPVTALKQKFTEEKSGGITLRKILVTAQFSIAIFLLTVGFMIYKQSNYMATRDMGFESNHILFANIVTDKRGSNADLRERLLKHPEIAEVCHSDYIPFILPGGADINYDGASEDQKVFIRYSQINYDFVPTYELNIVKGRNFSREYPSDFDKCLLNETAVRVFGWNDPIGHKIKIRGGDYTVIGIIKDYIVFSVHNPLEPHFYRLIPDTIRSNIVYSVRYKPGYMKQAEKIVKTEFEDFFPQDAFDFKHIGTLIQGENAVREWKKLMQFNIIFAILTILVSSIGLFGLILFYCRHKLKEVGIRKVLGFSSAQLYYSLSSGFIKLLIISIIFAWPSALYAYKILPGANKYPLSPAEFILATLIVLTVALATISFQIFRALKVRPVDILKDE